MEQTETRNSLLLRIRDRDDRDAWEEFSAIYRPAIIRLAKLKGLQNADAEDLSQRVMLAISRSIQSWNPDENRARFRTWLHRVTQNAIINLISRDGKYQATGTSEVMRLLESCPDHSPLNDEMLTVEIRRSVFRYAAKLVRNEFQPQTWEAFWLTAVEGMSVLEASDCLQLSVGSIYAAKSRVMKRLRDKITELQLTAEDEQ